MIPQLTWRTTARISVCALWLSLSACGGGGSSSNADSGTPAPTTSKLSGKVTYDSVPATLNGLDYRATKELPVRGAIVQAYDLSGTVLASTSTDDQGSYQLVLTPGIKVQVRVQARLLQDGIWDVAVRDNTAPAYAVKPDSAPIYALTSSTQNINGQDQLLNLHAASGWLDEKYANARSAAPFSILDQAYAAMQKIRQEVPTLQFPPLNIYWSVKNRPGDNDDKSNGEIQTSHFSPDDEALYILGKADVDTDEFDTAIIVHEWGHYFENKLSRSDSIGDSHAQGDFLDMRLAWGEGWGNGLAGLVRNNPIYIDTSGPSQKSTGPEFDVSDIPEEESDRSWYSETSMQYFIYQLGKASGGWSALLKTMLNEQRITPAYTSIFSFASGLKNHLPLASWPSIDALLTNINTPKLAEIDPWGQSVSYVVPTRSGKQAIYTNLSQNPTEICLSNSYSEPEIGNKLDQGRFLRFDAPDDGKYRIDIQESGKLMPGARPTVFNGSDSYEDSDDDYAAPPITFNFKKGIQRMWLVDELIVLGNEKYLFNTCYNVQITKE